MADRTPEELVAAVREAIDEAWQNGPEDHLWTCSYGIDDYPNCDCLLSTDIARRVEADRRVLDRHSPIEAFGCLACMHCGVAIHGRPGEPGWPCPDVVDLASRYGISVEEETRDG